MFLQMMDSIVQVTTLLGIEGMVLVDETAAEEEAQEEVEEVEQDLRPRTIHHAAGLLRIDNNRAPLKGAEHRVAALPCPEREGPPCAPLGPPEQGITSRKPISEA